MINYTRVNETEILLETGEHAVLWRVLSKGCDLYKVPGDTRIIYQVITDKEVERV
jgi:hypothetical protein